MKRHEGEEEWEGGAGTVFADDSISEHTTTLVTPQTRDDAHHGRKLLLLFRSFRIRSHRECAHAANAGRSERAEKQDDDFTSTKDKWE